MNFLKSIGGSVLRVVIVEDHPQLREILKRMIEEDPGLVCSGAYTTGEEALRDITSTTPDVVTLDLSLPDTSGIGVLEIIKKISPATRCIFFSGYADESYVRQTLEAGALGYLYKEDVSELVKCIHKIRAGEICVSERFESVAAQILTTNL